MQDYKEKLYQYETLPPDDMWDKIADELDGGKNINLKDLRSRPKWIFYGATAAAALLIIFLNNIFFSKKETDFQAGHATVKPIDIFSAEAKDSINLNYELLEKIINTPPNKKILASNNVIINGFSKRYLTVAGPEGQPVKISPKAATLIVSADKEYPPRPVWSDKIDKWQQIMLSHTTSPTPSGLLDIVQLAAGNFE